MHFGTAVELMKLGQLLTRDGWNGKGMYVFFVPGSEFKVNRPPLLGIYPEGTAITYRPHIDICHADGQVGTWSPSIGDVLADDWTLVPAKAEGK